MKYILWKDLAYSSELISEGEAAKVSYDFIREYSNGKSIFFTNVDWKESTASAKERIVSWTPFTDSTFDAGIIIKNENCIIVVWAEDED